MVVVHASVNHGNDVGGVLVVFDPATMREEVLLKNVPEGYFSWSPTEDYLIYMLTDEGER